MAPPARSTLEGVTSHTVAPISREVSATWLRAGGLAGIAYVAIAVVAGALAGAGPPADGRAVTYQSYFVTHQGQLIAQGWLYALAAPLLVVFAVAVRKAMADNTAASFLGEIFVLGMTAVTALLVVAMSMQIAITQYVDRLDAETFVAIGVHFVGVLVAVWGFVTALTACVYALIVFRHGATARWTGSLAILTMVVNLIGTAGVFARTGAFSVEGGFSAWAPAVSTVLWYLGTSVALLRAPRTMR